jgi:ectoine hydroxylase-related dioxygenase (phytanoyl-CoA dioxygenase family)
MVVDLSTKHTPVTTLFEPLSSRQDATRYRLTPEQIDFFHTNGYVAGVRLLNDEQIEVLREELSRLVDPNHPGRSLFYEFHANESTDPATVLFHALGAWRISAPFHDLLWSPAFLVPASQLLDGPVRFWHDQLFCKPAHHGGVVAWHQDYSYWTRTEPMAHLSCWIGLDDSSRENGCVHYVPGSHRWNLLPITGLANDMDAIRSVLTGSQKNQFQPVAIALKAGECSFHHPLMVHGSYENRSDRARRGAVINVLRDGVCSASNDPLLAGVPPIPSGEKLRGQFFPLLFDPSTHQVTT